MPETPVEDSNKCFPLDIYRGVFSISNSNLIDQAKHLSPVVLVSGSQVCHFQTTAYFTPYIPHSFKALFDAI